jgi:hypothetical protein
VTDLLEAINHKTKDWQAFFIIFYIEACRGIKKTMFKTKNGTPYLFLNFEVSCCFVQ